MPLLPNIQEVRWSTTRAHVGQTVEMTARFTEPAEMATSVVFHVNEYSGIPPQDGGGSREEEITQVVAEVKKGAAEAKGKWTVTLPPESSPAGGLPEFRFRARVSAHKDVPGLASKLLKLGSVQAIAWVAPQSETEQPSEHQRCKVAFEADEKVGMEVQVDGLEGFSATFIIFRRRPDRRTVESEEVGRVSDVPIRSGRAFAEWSIPEDDPHQLGGSQFSFRVELSHGASYAIRRPAPGLACHRAKVRMYVALYYIVPDSAFKRAALTWQREVESRADWDPHRSRFGVLESFRSRATFYGAWRGAREQMYKYARTSELAEVHVYSHAGINDEIDGLEFSDGTLTRTDMAGLVQLPWADDGLLVLHGCDTGVTEGRGWAPAGAFAQGQGVRTLGQAGPAYFSQVDGHHVSIDDSSHDVYLWAYNRSYGGLFGDGRKIPAVAF